MMSSANIVAEIQFELLNERAEEPCTCKYVTLLQSFHRGTLSIIHWYIAQFFSLPFLCPSYLDALLRLPCLADY